MNHRTPFRMNSCKWYPLAIGYFGGGNPALIV
jgi:hypothetical protein